MVLFFQVVHQVQTNYLQPSYPTTKMMKTMHTPLTTKSRSSVGDRRANRFAAVFDDSDSDNDAEVTVTRAAVTAPESESHDPMPSLLAAFMEDPTMRDLWEGKKSWGDIVYEDDMRNGRAHLWVSAPLPDRPAVTTEMDLWDAFEDTDLDEHIGDVYNTSGLTDAEFDRFMTWIYTNGWEVDTWERTWVRAWPVIDGPPNWPTVWKGLREELRAREPVRAPEPEHHHHGHGCCGGHRAAEPARLSAPGTDNGRRKGAPVPRFCKDGKRCATAGCRYVHGDTIQRLNDSCSFGAACGASDPTGVKRSQCLRMHPGEKWDPRLVINRV